MDERHALPDWNDLPAAARVALVAAAGRELEGTDAACIAGDVALRFYEVLREQVPPAVFPLFARPA